MRDGHYRFSGPVFRLLWFLHVCVFLRVTHHAITVTMMVQTWKTLSPLITACSDSNSELVLRNCVGSEHKNHVCVYPPLPEPRPVSDLLAAHVLSLSWSVCPAVKVLLPFLLFSVRTVVQR